MGTDGETRVNEGPESNVPLFVMADDARTSSSYWLDAFDDIAAHLTDFGASDTLSASALPSDDVAQGGADSFTDSIQLVFDGPIDTLGSSASNEWTPAFSASGMFHASADILKQQDDANVDHQNGVDVQIPTINRARSRQDYEMKQDEEDMRPKKPRLVECNTVRSSSSRDQCPPRVKERLFNQKRQRDGWEEGFKRDWDHGRYHISNEREHRNSGRRDFRGRDRREARGYWERDRSGSSELIFREGSWKPDFSKEGKLAKDNALRSNGELEKKSELTNENTLKSNAELMRKSEVPKRKFPEEKARQYQLYVLEQARSKNTIAFLETGAGKTLIAVLLIKSINDDMKKLSKKMLAVFLVPKVPLVYQQAEVIREQTGFQVGHYCGEMGQDFWDARRWHRELETKQVLVMTAQILLNILRHSIIKMEAINLLILDECHHAVKKHPYSLVMSEFYHTAPKEKRPSVFGMTASPVNLKGVSSQVDCAIKIRNLESKLDSVVCTIKDRKELEKHVPMPSEVVVEYDKAANLWSLHEQIKKIEMDVEQAAKSTLKKSKWQFMGARDAGAREKMCQVYGVSERTESDGAANLIQKFRAINYSLDELGQWCAYKVAQSFLVALQNDERVHYQSDVQFQESYLRKVLALLQCQLLEGAAPEIEAKSGGETESIRHSDNVEEMEEGELPESHVVSGGEHVDLITGAAVADGRVTPKVQSLIKILLKYQDTEDFRAIIFVERVVTALVLPHVFAELPSLSFVKCASLIGHNNSHEMRTSQMQDTIAKFRDGRVTLLVATSVAEEGLDIRQCNVVIRFDLAKTVLAYIQSRGRARKPGSDYILMSERGNSSHAAFLKNARNSEETLRREAVQRTDLSCVKDLSKFELIDNLPGITYQVESTGAVVTLNSAVGLVHLYCSQLPSDRYSILCPEFIMVKHEKPGGLVEYSCNLQLPCNAPFENLEGPVCSSPRLAQQAVCVAGCKKLHEMGAFTDMLLPDKGSKEEGKTDQGDEGDPLPGTARHREFYPEGIANILQGDWILSGKDGCTNSELVQVYMYAIQSENIGSSNDAFITHVSEFAILFGQELDAEVLSMSMDLFIARTMKTKASLVFQGVIDITESQLASLKNFHVRLMSIVLDVDVEPATTPWDPAKAYLFAPVVSDKMLDSRKHINWMLVKIIVSTDSWNNPLQRARPDVFLGTSERTLGGDRREYGFGKLRHGMAFGQTPHPTYGIKGAVAKFDVVKASGLLPNRASLKVLQEPIRPRDSLMTADDCIMGEDLIGRIVTAAHSGKRFYVDFVCYDMSAESSFPRKEGYLGPVEYSSYAQYYKQKYGVELVYTQQPLIRGRGVSYCKNLLSPRFEQSEENDDGKSTEVHDKTYYVFLPPELCLVHPLPGSLVRGAQRLPSIMRRVESILLAVQLKHMISYPIPASRILEALTAASCQETFCYERAELLGDAYLKWVVSRFLFLKHPQKHEGQLTRMRQQMVSNMVLYQFALNKGLQSYIQADRFAPSRWAAPGVPPVFDEDTRDIESLFDDDQYHSCTSHGTNHDVDDYDNDDMEDGELESDLSSYRVLSSKTLADVVEALIGVYYVEGGKTAANHLMKWIGIQVDFDFDETQCCARQPPVPESILRSINFDGLEKALKFKFNDKGLLVEAITHASRPSSGVSCYQRLEFVGDAVLDHLITRHLFFTYTDLSPGRLTDLRAAAVNNENFARVAVKHNIHVHLRHGSSALEKQIRDFVKEVEEELSKSTFNSFGLGDCKAPKVLGDIVESIAGAVFLDSGRNTTTVWEIFQPLLHPLVTPETLPMHPIRELQERCQQQAEGLEYKASRNGNLATVEVYVDGIQVGVAQNPQKKMAQKLAARNALVVLKDKESTQNAEEKTKEDETNSKNGTSTFTRQTLNDICLRRNWPMPLYRCVSEGGPAHAKRFTFSVRVNTSDKGWTDECVGEPMPSVKKAKDSAAILLLEILEKWYPSY